jgi:hypothetical protein
MGVDTSWSERVRVVVTTPVVESGSPAVPHPTSTLTGDGVALSAGPRRTMFFSWRKPRRG